jgi:hypothetical protein
VNIVKTVGRNSICYQSQPSMHIREYYNHCLSIILKRLSTTEDAINVIFGRIDCAFGNSNPIIRIDIQCEHAIVKDGGRGISERIFGETLDEAGSQYLIRIADYDYFKGLDVVIEYSIPNINHISKARLFHNYSKKLVYISALIYDMNFDRSNKFDTITLFTNNASDRRTLFTSNMAMNNIECVNVNNCYSSEDLVGQYDKTRILVNVHQTDHHHTFEELRVLPALQRGVLVVSEDVPLKSTIPYNEYVIWSSYDNLAKTVQEVQDNYDAYHKRIFNADLKALFLTMEKTNINNLNLIN